jgi:hypothetical protein
MELDGVDFPLPFRAVQRDGDLLRLAFMLDSATAVAFRSVARLFDQTQAA